MTRLHLIRHGRATAQGAAYDQLHAQGELQARLLGEHLARVRQRFDAVYVGPLVRQRETLRLMRDAAGEVGCGWPEPVTLEGLAEAPFEVLMRNFVRPRLAHDAAVRAFAAQIRAGTPESRDEGLRGLFDHMAQLWRNGELAAPGLETVADFGQRVIDALETMRAREGLGREVAVITSSGVISHLLEHVGVELGSGSARKLLYNTSVSLLEIDAAGVAARAHNLTLHLSDPQHLTVL